MVLSGISFVVVSTFSLSVVVVVVSIFLLDLSLAWFVVVSILSASLVCFSLGSLWSLHFRSVCERLHIVSLDK